MTKAQTATITHFTNIQAKKQDVIEEHQENCKVSNNAFFISRRGAEVAEKSGQDYHFIIVSH